MALVGILLPAVIATEAARLVETSSPALAVRLNPFNTNARLQQVTDRLNGETTEDFGDLKAEVQRGISFDPADARLRSALGEIALREGNADEAKSLFLQAHRLSQTERQAIRSLIRRGIEDRNYSEVLRLIDISLRRAPRDYEQFESILLGLLVTSAAYDNVIAMLRHPSPWRSSLLRSIARNDGESFLTLRVMQELMEGETPPPQADVAAVVQQLVRRKLYRDAYRVFLASMSDEDWMRAGFIYNSGFTTPLGVQPFDWTYASTARVEISLGGQAGSVPGATVRFLNTPVRELQLQQTLLLGPGKYRMTSVASARGLVIPRGLFWNIRCILPHRPIAALDIQPGTYIHADATVDFEVNECAVQMLELRSGLKVDSGRYAYAGSISFHNVSIERAHRD